VPPFNVSENALRVSRAECHGLIVFDVDLSSIQLGVEEIDPIELLGTLVHAVFEFVECSGVPVDVGKVSDNTLRVSGPPPGEVISVEAD